VKEDAKRIPYLADRRE